MKGDFEEETVKNACCAFLLQTPEFENKVGAKKKRLLKEVKSGRRGCRSDVFGGKGQGLVR